MRSTADVAKAKARASGLSIQSNSSGQDALRVDFGFGNVEVDWRNLCPESVGELGDKLSFPDFLILSGGFAEPANQRKNNQFTAIGYTLPGSGFSTTSGCYVLYDSFGNPNCTVQVVTTDC